MNSWTDVITILSLLFSGIAALAAAVALRQSAREMKTNMKEDFVLWAIERLRQDDLRASRALIFSLSDEKIKEIEQDIRDRKQPEHIDEIRLVCLAFDEIGYFIYKMGLVEFRDILDIYPQTIKIWNKVAGIIRAWREIEGPFSFVYFEMLARQERLKVNPQFEPPIKLVKS